jgi:hypothetical protein
MSKKQYTAKKKKAIEKYRTNKEFRENKNKANKINHKKNMKSSVYAKIIKYRTSRSNYMQSIETHREHIHNLHKKIRYVNIMIEKLLLELENEKRKKLRARISN